MINIETIERTFYLNLFSNFILSKVEPGSSVSITDLNNFVVIKGNLISSETLNLYELTKEFSQTHKNLFQEEIKINTIDILSYNQTQTLYTTREVIKIK